MERSQTHPEKKHVVTYEVGLTCDIIEAYFYKPIIIGFTNPSCSTSTSISSSSDGFTCDASLMIENKTLKKEVNELTRALGKACGGEHRLLICLGSQRASLYKEGLGYIHKKGKAAFAPHKRRTMAGIAIITRKLVTKSMIALTRNHMLMYPLSSLILVIYLLRVPMV
jgi:hypothetical protein